MENIIVFAAPGADREFALGVAEKLDIELTEKITEASRDLLLLQIAPDGVSLRQGNLVMQGDFSKLSLRVTPGKIGQEMLFKAAKIKNFENTPLAVDATAGMGEDSFILAAAGARVKLFEKDPIIALLLSDALRRGKNDPKIAAVISRMEFAEGDSLEYMRETDEKPDIIYLDPMFPARSKSGLIKKKFQLLGQLEPPATDGEEMLRAAMNLRPKKIIVKRPAKGENLGNYKPHYSLKGKAIRYDCFVFA
ncbi:MAG: class I SAM-dependent methyltransferase [Lachnospiraceae bacterium]|nr:class I SAM-dependent methyltransferase [Lachnospiraceae bacterium]